MAKALPIFLAVGLFATIADAAPAGTAVWLASSGVAPSPALAAIGNGAVLPASHGPALAAPGVVYLGTDNLDPRAGVLAGVLLQDGTLATAGQTAVVTLTLASTKPANGSSVWLASSMEDGRYEYYGYDTPSPASARGKCTSIKPTLVEPAYPDRRQNLALCGTVVDNSTFDSDHTVTVRVASGGGVQYVATDGTPTNSPDTTQIFHGVRCSTGNTFTADGTPAQMKINNNESFVVSFVTDNVTTAAGVHDFGWRNWDEVNRQGWWIDTTDPMSFVFFLSWEAGGHHQPDFTGSLNPGLNIVAVSRHDGLFHISVDGYVVGTTTDAGADAVTGQTFTIDYGLGVTTGMVKLARAMNDTELQAVSGKPIDSAPWDEHANPFGPDPALTADPACQWYTDVTAYTGGTLHAFAGAAGTAFNWTTNGAPALRTWTMTWRHSLAPYFQDGDAPTYDSRHSLRATPFSRMRFHVQNQWEFALMRWGLISEDWDNNDEADLTMFASSGTVKVSPICRDFQGSDGSLWFFAPCWNMRPGDPSWWQAIGAGPYDMDLVIGDSIIRVTTFASGDYYNRIGMVTSVTETGAGTRATSTIETDFSTTRRLVIVSEGTELGGHEADFINQSPISGAPCTRIRAAFPGKVTCEIYPIMNIDHVVRWGDGDVSAYAHRVVDLSHLGNPSFRQIVIALGFMDWRSAPAISANAATTIARYARFVDAIHAIDPVVQLFVVLPIQTPGYSVVNDTGDTLQAYADGIGALTVSRPWLTKLDISGPTPITWVTPAPAGNLWLPDRGAGQQAVADNFKAALGY